MINNITVVYVLQNVKRIPKTKKKNITKLISNKLLVGSTIQSIKIIQQHNNNFACHLIVGLFLFALYIFIVICIVIPSTAKMCFY